MSSSAPHNNRLPAISVYAGNVRHARYKPRQHVFSYRVFTFLIDIDKLGEAAQYSRLFSINSFNIFSFFSKDHGYQNHQPVRQFVDELALQNGRKRPDQVYLLCYPRVLGYVFNPLSVYYLINDGKLTGLLYEVRNTFGEKHCYYSAIDAKLDETVLHSHDKAFHVSPFIGMQARYHFSTSLPHTQARLVIRETEQGAPLLITSFTGVRLPFSNRTLTGLVLRYPLMTLKVILAIHFEALRIFLKGVGFIPHPKKSASKGS